MMTETDDIVHVAAITHGAAPMSVTLQDTTTDAWRASAARRLIRAATGEEHGDGDIVVDMGAGYAYGNDGWPRDQWVTGNWNDKTVYDRETGARIVTSTVPSRLLAALERVGIECLWSDENDPCHECGRLIRTQPDSYGWTPQYVIVESAILCRDCALSDIDTFLDEYVNNSARAVTLLSLDELAEHGWRPAFGDDSVSGWHPGQNDTPAGDVERWRADNPDSADDYVFVVTDKGQFDVHWRMLVRASEGDDE